MRRTSRSSSIELENRYCAELVAESSDHDAFLVRRIGDQARALYRRDWTAMEALYAPDLVAVNQRKLSLPLSDRTSLIELLQTMIAVQPDALSIAQTLETRGDAVLVRPESNGTTKEGNRYSWASWVIWRNGVWAGVELFPDDEPDAARARFEELGS